MTRETSVGTCNSMTAGVEADGYGEGRGLPASPRVMDSDAPRAWDGQLAALISTVGSPPVLASTALLVTALTLSSPRAWMWVGIYLLLGVLTPFLYLVWLVKRGDVTDVDVQLRKQRAQPLLVTIACTAVGWLGLALGGAPVTITLVVGGIWLQLVVIFMVTLRWKISVHAATAAASMTVVWALLGTPVPMLLIVPLVAWSRVRLRCHTVLQAAAGALLGFVVFLTVTTFIPSQ